MRQLAALERRLQTLERNIENVERYGEIVDVKFDSEKKRWYVKLNDGEDKTPAQDGAINSNRQTFKSDWLPWKSFSHGTISASIPPRKGMKAMMRTPAGMPQMASAEPFHFSNENPSPHDKEDEVFVQIQRPQDKNARAADDGKNETLQIHASKDFTRITLGGTTFEITASSVTVTTQTYKVKADTIELEADDFKAKTGNVDWSNG